MRHASVNAATAPATVSGKLTPDMPLKPRKRPGKAGESARAASQETCRHKLPIFRAWGAAERSPVAAADVSTEGESRQVMNVAWWGIFVLTEPESRVA